MCYVQLFSMSYVSVSGRLVALLSTSYVHVFGVCHVLLFTIKTIEFPDRAVGLVATLSEIILLLAHFATVPSWDCPNNLQRGCREYSLFGFVEFPQQTYQEHVRLGPHVFV